MTLVANQLLATREPRKLKRVLYQNCWRWWINNQANRASGLWPTYRILNSKQPFGNCIWFPPHLKRWTGGPATSITVIQSGARRLNTVSTEACQEITSPKIYLVWFCLTDLGPQIGYSDWLTDWRFYLLPTECESSPLKQTTTASTIYHSQSYIHCYITYTTVGKFVPLPKYHATKKYRGMTKLA